MPVTADEIRSTVAGYLRRHPGERGRLAGLLEALADGWDLSSRKERRGHVTCGVLLLDDEGRALHVHHRTLGRWLFPGGHLDPEDSSLVLAALRELREETGITADRLVPIGDQAPLDIDVHAIPDHPARGEPGHWHADFLYAFHGSAIDVVLDRDEVTEFAWLESPAAARLHSEPKSTDQIGRQAISALDRWIPAKLDVPGGAGDGAAG